MRHVIDTDGPSTCYDAFLRRKIEVARLSMLTGDGLSNDEVEAEFAARRAKAKAAN